MRTSETEVYIENNVFANSIFILQHIFSVTSLFTILCHSASTFPSFGALSVSANNIAPLQCTPLLVHCTALHCTALHWTVTEEILHINVQWTLVPRLTHFCNNYNGQNWSPCILNVCPLRITNHLFTCGILKKRIKAVSVWPCYLVQKCVSLLSNNTF